jgi:hypothetical protein
MVDKVGSLPPFDVDDRPSSLSDWFGDDGELVFENYHDILQREEEEERHE